jgi:hypothetical protein
MVGHVTPEAFHGGPLAALEEGDTVVLDVEARGGSRAGIVRVAVSDGTRTLIAQQGEGATWGGTIVTGKSRGSETATLVFAVPEHQVAGDTLALQIQVGYVVAMSAGAGSFENEPHDDVVRLDVRVYSDGDRLVARLLQVAIAALVFALWFGLVAGIALLYARADDRASPSERTGSETEGIGLLMGVVGGGVMGYWLFARRLMNMLETQSTVWAFMLTAAWIAIPLAWAWRWSKRRGRRPVANVPTAVARIVRSHTNDIRYESPLSSALMLEMSKVRLRYLVELEPALAEVVTWIETTLASSTLDEPDPVLRRRVLALDWVLVMAEVPLQRGSSSDARDDLVRAIRDATAIDHEDDAVALAERVRRDLAALR